MCDYVCNCSAVQSSVFNENYPDLALDGDPDTCAVTGWGTIEQWWKVDLKSRRTVTGVRLTGEALRSCAAIYRKQ